MNAPLPPHRVGRIEAAALPSWIVAAAVTAGAVLASAPIRAAEPVAAKAPAATAERSAGTASTPTPAATTLRSIAIRDGKSDAPEQTIVVAQGAQVELRWRSDRPITLHLHGYDIETRVTPPAAATMTFPARLAGRFPVTEHRQDGRHHRAVAYLEVRP